MDSRARRDADEAGAPVTPADPLEQQVARIVADVLVAPHIGARDSFFEAGGNALLAARVAARLRDELGVEIPLTPFLLAPTVADLTELVERSQDTTHCREPGCVSGVMVRRRWLPWLTAGWAVQLLRWVCGVVFRVVVCEPFFKACCKKYGRRLRTGTSVHRVRGRGDIVIGDDVTIEGRVTITFAARPSHTPMLDIGDRTRISSGCLLAVAGRVSIGKDCVIADDTILLDVRSHPVDLDARCSPPPLSHEDERPVIIEDNVWIGRRAVIFPGVRIGEGSVVSAGSRVRADVPPNTFVAPETRTNVTRLAGRRGS